MTTPALILVCGRPASGKSTLAKGLAKELGALLIDKDCIDEAFSPADRGPLYQAIVQPRAYQALLNLAEPNLLLKRKVILDAPWTHNFLHFPALAQQVVALSESTQSRLIVLDIVLPPAIVRQRLTQRGLERDKAKLTEEGWPEFVTRHRFGEKNPLSHFIIDGQLSPDGCFSQALLHIQSLLK